MLAKHILIALLGITCWATAHRDRLMILLPHGSHQVLPADWMLPTTTADPESLLALGYRLSLHCADLFSLELIPGVSDKMGIALLQNKDEITRSISSGTLISKALQGTHGVGPVTATKLARYLEGSAPCNFSTMDSHVP